MTQSEFMQQLLAGLARLSEGERAEIEADYRAYFADALADGRSEADVAAALGDPQKLARELCAERKMAQWEARKTPAHLGQVLVAMAGLGVINMLLLLPYLVLLTVVSSLWLSALSVLLAGLVVTAGWTSHTVFGWPDAARVTLSERGAWPWADSLPSSIHIQGSSGESVHIAPDASGSVTITAQDGDERVTLARDADGHIQALHLSNGQDQLEINGLRPPGWGSVLVVGLVLMVLGGVGSVLGWLVLRALWRGTGSWLRWQQRLIEGGREQQAATA
ncbi:DUF1700 domain-containing protein [Chitinibacteraceae bacterium HSL-7]